MSILITGVNGFVGKALYKRLSLSRSVIGIARQKTELPGNIQALDLTNEKQTLDFFENHKEISCVVHLASRMANKDNVNDLSVLNENAAMAKNIALGAKLAGVKKIVHLSSSSVYSNTDGRYDEKAIADPSKNADAIYGLSKYNAEVILEHFLSGTVNLTHLRTAMIYGEGMDASRIIPVLIEEIKTKNTATLFGNGERLLNLVQVDRLSEYIEFFIGNSASGIFNVADECISLVDLAKRLIAEYGSSESKLILNPAGNKHQFILDTTKLNQLLEKAKHV
ncbi:NADH(P)-binding protein [Sphingobacteriaceae bacterium]|nr:NADH(P)-binding protein [Sphingobacteriaceae bacterium]